jgi:hypothetical protein
MEDSIPPEFRRSLAESFVEKAVRWPFTVLVGFDAEPESFEAQVERRGGVVLLTTGSGGGGEAPPEPDSRKDLAVRPTAPARGELVVLRAESRHAAPRPPERTRLDRPVRREGAQRAEANRPLGARFAVDNRDVGDRFVRRAAVPAAPRTRPVAGGPSGLVTPNRAHIF